MSMKYVVPALAVAGRAAAQCSAATTTIQGTATIPCSTFSGSIALATDAASSVDLGDTLDTITGSLIANNISSVLSFSGSGLTTIGDSFDINGLTQLTSLNFPQLTAVDSINWQALPELEGLQFSATVQKASTVNIQNTDLSSLDGIDLEVVDTLILVNNPSLSKINMQLGNVSTGITVEANGRDLQVSFPNMMWANNITIRNASEVAIPSLASVNGSMGFYNCDLQNLTAPNLTSVGGGLALISNDGLANISFPELTQVSGALNIANNTDLDDISFPSLQTVDGAIDFYGNFSSVELPKISLVKGAFNLQSSTDITKACDYFYKLRGSNNVIHGKYSCKGNLNHPSSTGTLKPGTNDGNGTGSGSSASSSSTSGSFATSVMVPTAGSLLGVVAAMFGIF